MLDKLFRPSDIRGACPLPLNEETAWKIGHATGLFFKRSRQNIPESLKVPHENTILSGRDSRPSSPQLQRSLIEGLRSTGITVIDLGPIDTPFLYFAVNHEACVAGIQTTGSHGPVDSNGFRITGPYARPVAAATGLEDIRRISSTLRIGQTGVTGKLETKDLWQPYRQHVLRFLSLRRKLRVAVDAGSAIAAKMIPAVFNDAPSLEIVPVSFEIAGSFPRDPGPLDQSNLDLLKTAIAQTSADLGVCFDADADRCIFLTETGNAIASDLVAALLTRHFLTLPTNKGAAIVYDLRCSRVVREETEAAGGAPFRQRAAYPAIRKAMDDTSAVFGCEPSGRFYFRDNFHADSAAIAFACLLSVLSSQQTPLSQLIAPLRRYAHSGEIAFHIEDKDAKIREIAEAHRKAQSHYLDGFTVESPDWWFNIRKSPSDPLLLLNLEANSPRLLDEKLKDLQRILGQPLHIPFPSN